MTDSQIELLINSKNPEDVKLAVNLLESRENLKRVEAKMSSFENWDKERKIRYHKLGYGYILNKENGIYEMPMSVRNDKEKFLNSPTWAEVSDRIAIHKMESVTRVLSTSVGFILLLIILGWMT